MDFKGPLTVLYVQKYILMDLPVSMTFGIMPPPMGNKQAIPMHMYLVTWPTRHARMNSHPTIQQPNPMFALQPQQIKGNPYTIMVPQQCMETKCPIHTTSQCIVESRGMWHGQVGARPMDYGLFVRDDSGPENPYSSSQVSSSLHLPLTKQKMKPDDKLFGNLVDMTKVKTS